MKIFITYDLQQTAQNTTPENEVTIRGAKEVSISGPLLTWHTGEFIHSSGGHFYGVKIEFTDPIIGPAHQWLPVPPNASNVQVHDHLPPEYQAALETAA